MAGGTLDLVPFITWLDDGIRRVLAAPGAWGGVHALEPVILALLMVRWRTVDFDGDDHDLLRRYRAYLARVTFPSAAPLLDRLPAEGREEHMVKVLGDFVSEIGAVMESHREDARQ